MRLHAVIRRTVTDSQLFYAVKVLIALAGTLLPALQHDNFNATIMLSLGVIAAAIAESEHHFRGRIKNLLIMLICFALAITSVQLLFPYPWLFACGLFASTFIFVMIGALGSGYANISLAALIIAIYTMLGMNVTLDFWSQPTWLLGGTLWYGFVSLIMLWLQPHQNIHEPLAQLSFHLSRYLKEKAKFFPIDPEQTPAIRHQLAQLHIPLVNSSQLLHEAFLLRKNDRSASLQRLQQQYMLLLEIHERIVASHFPYADLQQTIGQSELISGYREILLLLSEACYQLGRSIRAQIPYQHPQLLHWAIHALHDQLQQALSKQVYPESLATLLQLLWKNLSEINLRLERSQELPVQESLQLSFCKQPRNKNLRHLFSHFSTQSLLFRHAIRMSLCLTSGYILVQWLHSEHGYWILLTCLFVCQPSYSATRKRLFQRISGTLIGLLLASPLLILFPSPLEKLVLLVLCGVLFFSQLRSHYNIAVIFITLFVVFAFNLLDQEGYAIMGERLAYTLAGGVIAFAFVRLLWPDWQIRKLPKLLAQSLTNNACYLHTIMRQDHSGKHDCRQNAYQADNEVAKTWQQMLVEPRSCDQKLQLCHRISVASHTLLAYIAALGAHNHEHHQNSDPRLHQHAEWIISILQDSANQLLEMPKASQHIPKPSPFNIAMDGVSLQLQQIENETLMLWQLAHDLSHQAKIVPPEATR